MPIIFRYFWFVCAAFMAVNVTIWRRQFASLIARGIVTKAEADGFVRWAAVWLVGASIVLGVIGLTAGWPSPFCAGVFAFDSWPRALTSLVLIGSSVSVFLWVWTGSGADVIGRVFPVLVQQPAGRTSVMRISPGTVRVFATILIVVSSVGAAVASRTMVVSADMMCAATTNGPAR